jgi:hypothetical protein
MVKKFFSGKFEAETRGSGAELDEETGGVDQTDEEEDRRPGK